MRHNILAAMERAAVLLKATTDFMERNPIAAEYTVFYDDAVCGGSCLADDCAHAYEDLALAIEELIGIPPKE